ncbi:hypothetical protein QQ054_27510 [Oscillatoria amoena NRMC-F 0135]|nr:hypothetical protein [Oscillatoria amoena NRMC-F 0135]
MKKSLHFSSLARRFLMGIVVSTVLLLTLETQAAYSALAVEGDVFNRDGRLKKNL